jgi:hypothetical protein
MTRNAFESTNKLLKATQLDAQFERLLDALILQVRHALGVPPPGPDQHPQVEEEFARLRVRLQGFFPEYQGMLHELFVKHLGEADLFASAEALSVEPVARYFDAMRRMEPELNARLRDLTQRMGDTEIQSS